VGPSLALPTECTGNNQKAKEKPSRRGGREKKGNRCDFSGGLLGEVSSPSKLKIGGVLWKKRKRVRPSNKGGGKKVL